MPEVTATHGFRYRDETHTTLPHIVAMSGGRSSAMMLLTLAEQGALRPDRGDLAVFANTGAEHPATYDFVAAVKDNCENTYGIPVFCLEFVRRGDAGRTYRLVNPDEWDTTGAVFESMVERAQFMPSFHRRICTAELKVQRILNLTADWLGPLAGPREGTQRWADYTTAPVWADGTGRRPAPIWSRRRDVWPRFLNLIGLRADEPLRLTRMESKSLQSEGCAQQSTQPAGCYTYAPLALMGVTRREVADYWAAAPYDLGIDSTLGNCVFCPLKSRRKLVQLAARPTDAGDAGTPRDISWWAQLEQRFARDGQKHDGAKFGAGGVTDDPRLYYGAIIDDAAAAGHQPALEWDETDGPACVTCTD